jgi:hypothetical protein
MCLVFGVNQCGPFHHSSQEEREVGANPPDIKSAGLEAEDTCLHVALLVSS